MSETPYHFGSPFHWEINSTKNKVNANNNVQGSAAAVLANSYNVCSFEEGFRVDHPEFGIPPLIFQTIPIDLDALEEAISFWEPEASPQITEEAAELMEQAQRIVTITITGGEPK